MNRIWKKKGDKQKKKNIVAQTNTLLRLEPAVRVTVQVKGSDVFRKIGYAP